MIITRTPFRISFFGGGTDYPAWYREHGGAVLATTINKYCHITCRYLPPFFSHKHRIVYSRIENVREISEIQHPAVRAVLQWMQISEGLEIHHDGDLPARSGLGSSSSFTTGLILALRALHGHHTGKMDLATQAIHVEQNVIGENVGSQDQASAAFGGFNRIEFRRDGSLDVAPAVVPPERLNALQDHLMLCFTGVSRIASDIAGKKIENIARREHELHCMQAMVDQALAILQDRSRSLEDFGALLNDSWQFKRKLSDVVSNPLIDGLYDTAMAHGAIGGKILGAGGGGFLLLFVPPERQAAVKAALGHLVHVPFRFENTGSKVVLYQPEGL